ncbi:tetratricopeptide repeat protein [Azospirillum agricola]|uniref:tetratricopeptide repeat protein n=1 Tax=Azospirillum agricola TaxID=1720247 RepID=UPI000A0EFAFE|nr:hypothetical protein [Azospirillum agricola]SMH56694.1 hypothetical protein SAMN02982994_4135 [Azospirillum lipoferum]
MATISEALRIAVGLHQGNRLPEAASLYERTLDADPTVAAAWHLLGVPRLQTGDHSRAAGFMAFNPTPAGRAFLDRVVAHIGWSFDRGRAFWTLDQTAPYCVHDWMARCGAVPSVVWHDFEAFPYMRFLAR